VLIQLFYNVPESNIMINTSA